jgi:pyruvate formate lyase activating enzyme
VRCNLCAHRCVIPPGKLRAACVNRDGTLVTLVYERAISQHIDRSRKEAAVSFSPQQPFLLYRHRRCTFRMRLLPELGDLSIAARGARGAGQARRGSGGWAPGAGADPRGAAGRHRTGGAQERLRVDLVHYTEPTIFASMRWIRREAVGGGLKNGLRQQRLHDAGCWI